jgi:hypothetical protein
VGSCRSFDEFSDLAVALGECNDAFDNDGDQLIDTDDPDCPNSLGFSEEPDLDEDGIPDAVDPFPSDPENEKACFPSAEVGHSGGLA